VGEALIPPSYLQAIFGSDGTIAGILGSAAVAVDIDGLPMHDETGKRAEIEFTGLPLRGRVRVGKKLLEARSCLPHQRI
jgi:hypothetical protein